MYTATTTKPSSFFFHLYRYVRHSVDFFFCHIEYYSYMIRLIVYMKWTCCAHFFCPYSFQWMLHRYCFFFLDIFFFFTLNTFYQLTDIRFIHVRMHLSWKVSDLVHGVTDKRWRVRQRKSSLECLQSFIFTHRGKKKSWRKITEFHTLQIWYIESVTCSTQLV